MIKLHNRYPEGIVCFTSFVGCASFSNERRIDSLTTTTIIVDGSAAIPIDAWESNIDKVATGISYIINSLQLRVWSGTKKLSTTQRTVIRQVEDEQLGVLEIEATSITQVQNHYR